MAICLKQFFLGSPCSGAETLIVLIPLLLQQRWCRNHAPAV